MRNLPSYFRSAWPVAAFFFVAILLLFPGTLLAVPTQASVGRQPRNHRKSSMSYRAHGHRVSATSHRAHTRMRHASVAARRSAAPVSSTHLHSVEMRHPRTGTRSWERRHRVEAELDNIRTHTTPNQATANSSEQDLAHDQVEESTAPSLIAPAQPVAASPGQRDLPFFDVSIPSYTPVALRGSHEVLVHQNIIADVEGLSRIQDDEQLSAMVRTGDLVALPDSSAMVVDPRLPSNRRYCRAWTAKFLNDLARAHEKLFGHPLLLTSAVRTVEFQRHLAHYNGNAAPSSGDTASPHLTGQAIDIGKKGMSLREIAWMRAVLGQLQASGRLDVEEEFEQACFHISVYKTYAPHSEAPERLVASENSPSTDEVQAEGASAVPTIGAPAKPVSQPAVRTVELHRSHSYVRRAVVRRHRRRHHANMSLLAARLR